MLNYELYLIYIFFNTVIAININNNLCYFGRDAILNVL